MENLKNLANRAYKDDKKYWYHTINNLPDLKIKKNGKIKMPDGEIIHFEIGNYVILPQSTNPNKIFILQEISFKTKKEEGYHGEVRIGYHIIGKKPRVKGKWVWGQFAAFIPKNDLINLIDMAKSNNIL